jgi:DNA-binding NtrC family response regulator
MKVMIVGSTRELRRKLLTWMPVSEGHEVLEASGMLSAAWYAGNCHPDMIVLDHSSCDARGEEMVDLFTQVTPDASVLVDEPDGGLELLFRDSAAGKLVPESFYGRPFDAAAWRDVEPPFVNP